MNMTLVCSFAKTIMDTIVFSGSLAHLTSVDMFTCVSCFNCWWSRWCQENNVGYIDNWQTFCVNFSFLEIWPNSLAIQEHDNLGLRPGGRVAVLHVFLHLPTFYHPPTQRNQTLHNDCFCSQTTLI